MLFLWISKHSHPTCRTCHQQPFPDVWQQIRMCLGTFSQPARSLATNFLIARVRIVGTQCLLCTRELQRNFLVHKKALCFQRASLLCFTSLFRQFERTLQRNDPVKYRIFLGAVLAVCTEITISYKLEAVISFCLCKSRFTVALL